MYSLILYCGIILIATTLFILQWNGERTPKEIYFPVDTIVTLTFRTGRIATTTWKITPLIRKKTNVPEENSNRCSESVRIRVCIGLKRRCRLLAVDRVVVRRKRLEGNRGYEKHSEVRYLEEKFTFNSSVKARCSRERVHRVVTCCRNFYYIPSSIYLILPLNAYN